MTQIRDYSFSTERLVVNEWHSLGFNEGLDKDLDRVVQKILTERVTQSLPPAWQGEYTLSRAQEWIAERDNEGITLLAIDKASKHAVGMVILFESNSNGELRLDYMLNETEWGKGFASELIKGFVKWCLDHDIKSITGGVERDNIASRRVLEKCGFEAVQETGTSEEQLFVLEFGAKFPKG